MSPAVSRLASKIAIVTGGARGQGAATAELFVAEGASVLIGDVLDERGGELADRLGPSATYIHLDVSDEASWELAMERVVELHGGLDILINNAGIVRPTPIIGGSLDVYMEIIRVNQVGCWLGMRAAAPLMVERGGGSIVNLSSVQGLVGLAGVSAYVASKFAVTGMTKTAALELGPHKIRVNSLHPGAVDTEMIRPSELVGIVDAAAEKVAKTIPIGRFSEASEMAKAVLFLASDESSSCTGTALVADGGILAGPSYD
jgi:3alpha(or 20beta)-hydroxysteroid dehydrogenase